MPASSKTLGAIINSGMREVGEPEISAFTETNILEKTLINAANRAVRELVDRTDFSWRLKRTILVTTDDITTESAAVTLNSTTISSVDSAGSGATNWGSATTNMYFRADGTQKSYKIATATSSSSQALETAYIGATSTAIG